MSIATCIKVIWAGNIGGTLWWMRDDKAVGITIEERYSLFRERGDDYGRVEIFTGPRKWALKESWKFIENSFDDR